VPNPEHVYKTKDQNIVFPAATFTKHNSRKYSNSIRLIHSVVLKDAQTIKLCCITDTDVTQRSKI